MSPILLMTLEIFFANGDCFCKLEILTYFFSTLDITPYYCLQSYLMTPQSEMNYNFLTNSYVVASVFCSTAGNTLTYMSFVNVYIFLKNKFLEVKLLIKTNVDFKFKQILPKYLPKRLTNVQSHVQNMSNKPLLLLVKSVNNFIYYCFNLYFLLSQVEHLSCVQKTFLFPFL